jgi:hypothetical protein
VHRQHHWVEKSRRDHEYLGFRPTVLKCRLGAGRDHIIIFSARITILGPWKATQLFVAITTNAVVEQADPVQFTDVDEAHVKVADSGPVVVVVSA